jgi:predicted AlkP superfamily pyrophosphatase or phosphodiesterase
MPIHSGLLRLETSLRALSLAATLALSMATISSCAQGEIGLVVGITVDQMRADYLTRYTHGYGTDGFVRMQQEGFSAGDHHFGYAPTYTGPGHASIATGTTPAVHGIIGNDWFERSSGTRIYCASDSTVQPVAMDPPSSGVAPGRGGQMSPHRMQSTTWADELKLHHGGRSKVIGMSMKDRGAIMPAGHSADAAYWFVGGDFISSTHYLDTLPGWVAEFNRSDAAEDYIAQGWDLFAPAEEYSGSTEDLTPYEGVFKGRIRPTFPYDLTALADQNSGLDILKATPHGNSLLVDFALQAIEAEELGQDQNTDVLAISFSSTDYIGHRFGSHAMETEDIYRRLDHDLARLFDALDREVGAGNWLAFLTADHGGATVPSMAQALQMSGGYFNSAPMVAHVDSVLPGLVRSYDNNQFFLDRSALRAMSAMGHSAEDVSQTIVDIARQYPEVHAAYTSAQLQSGQFDGAPGVHAQRGWHPEASGDVSVILRPGFISYGRTGTTHGSAWAYDTHVPLLFLGAGIPHRQTFETTLIRDIAPTLSALLGFPRPSGCTGSPIGPLLEK